MTKEEMIFEMAKSIAPVVTQKGIEKQQDIIMAGYDPSKCTIGDKDIPHAYGESLKVWATALVDELLTK